MHAMIETQFPYKPNSLISYSPLSNTLGVIHAVRLPIVAASLLLHAGNLDRLLP
jgi:hypothetical protein